MNNDFDNLKTVTRTAMLMRALNSHEAQNLDPDSSTFFMVRYAARQIDEILMTLHELPGGSELIDTISKDETHLAWNANDARSSLLSYSSAKASEWVLRQEETA